MSDCIDKAMDALPEMFIRIDGTSTGRGPCLIAVSEDHEDGEYEIATFHCTECRDRSTEEWERTYEADQVEAVVDHVMRSLEAPDPTPPPLTEEQLYLASVYADTLDKCYEQQYIDGINNDDVGCIARILRVVAVEKTAEPGSAPIPAPIRELVHAIAHEAHTRGRIYEQTDKPKLPAQEFSALDRFVDSMLDRHEAQQEEPSP